MVMVVDDMVPHHDLCTPYIGILFHYPRPRTALVSNHLPVACCACYFLPAHDDLPTSSVEKLLPRPQGQALESNAGTRLLPSGALGRLRRVWMGRGRTRGAVR